MGAFYSNLARLRARHTLAAVMILTAQSPGSGSPSVPLSFLEEVSRVLAQHKAIRIMPEDEAVTVEEARRLLSVPEGFVEDAVALGVFKRASSSDCSSMVRLDSVLEYQRERDKSPPRDDLDEFFDELKALGLY